MKRQYGKLRSQQKGFTLIECIVSIVFIFIIITSIFLLFSFAFNNYKHYIDSRQIKHDVHITLKYIEKRLKEFNQEDIIFDGDKNIFQGKNYDNKSVWVDLSGKKSFKTNTMIYFYRPTKEIRVNKDKEHNVLCGNIGDIIVNELVEGQLIEIEVIADKIEYSAKIKLNLNYSKEN